MQGKLGGDDKELSLEDQANALRQVISELQKKKETLEKDISTAYQEQRNKLNLEFNEKSGNLDKEYNKKMDYILVQTDILNKREAATKSAEVSAKATANSLIDAAKSRENQAELAEKTYNQLADELAVSYKKAELDLGIKAKGYESTLEELQKERKSLYDKKSSFNLLIQENNDISVQLRKELKDLEGKRAFLKFYANELDEKEVSLKAREDQIAAKELDIKNIHNTIFEQDKESKDILEQARILLDTNKNKVEKLKVDIENTKKEGAALGAWRAELNETKLTLSEKERYLLLRDREIDGKIKILNKLREGV